MPTDRDLTDEQRTWMPSTPAEAWKCWPNGKMEYYGSVLVFTSDAEWDWRSVAVAARAYPGCPVTLQDGEGLTIRLDPES